MRQRSLSILATVLGAMLAPGCENSLLDRSLIFTTNTTLGVEVAISPADSTSPVKLIIGYKRFEGVLNPVYHSHGVVGPIAPSSGSSPAPEEEQRGGTWAGPVNRSRTTRRPGCPRG